MQSGDVAEPALVEADLARKRAGVVRMTWPRIGGAGPVRAPGPLGPGGEAFWPRP